MAASSLPSKKEIAESLLNKALNLLSCLIEHLPAKFIGSQLDGATVILNTIRISDLEPEGKCSRCGFKDSYDGMKCDPGITIMFKPCSNPWYIKHLYCSELTNRFRPFTQDESKRQILMEKAKEKVPTQQPISDHLKALLPAIFHPFHLLGGNPDDKESVFVPNYWNLDAKLSNYKLDDGTGQISETLKTRFSYTTIFRDYDSSILRIVCGKCSSHVSEMEPWAHSGSFCQFVSCSWCDRELPLEVLGFLMDKYIRNDYFIRD